MAKFNTVGFEEVEKQFLRASEIATKAVPLMLDAGADVLVEAQKKEADQLFGISARSKGDLKRSIKKSKVTVTSVNATITVAPEGKDSGGVRNAEKGFVLNYGRSNMPAQPWMDAANTKSEDKVHGAYNEVWEELNNGN